MRQDGRGKDWRCVAGPAGLPLVALVRVAGSRWRVEEAFQANGQARDRTCHYRRQATWDP
jgi:hypothetical protein